jgi:hypothetical protein
MSCYVAFASLDLMSVLSTCLIYPRYMTRGSCGHRILWWEPLAASHRFSLDDNKLNQRCISSIVQINEASLIADVGLEP